MLLLLASVFLTAQGASLDLRNLAVVRFDFDNDVFLGKDNSFTAGWSVQVHSRLNDVWGPGTAKWIGRVPGLGDGGRGGRITRWAVGISQVIITPKDVGTRRRNRMTRRGRGCSAPPCPGPPTTIAGWRGCRSTPDAWGRAPRRSPCRSSCTAISVSAPSPRGGTTSSSTRRCST